MYLTFIIIFTRTSNSTNKTTTLIFIISNKELRITPKDVLSLQVFHIPTTIPTHEGIT